jgi:twitching motility protein PilT
MSNLSVSPILDYANKKNASDIHISEWSLIVLRVNWDLLPLESTWILEKVKVNQILLELLNEQKELIKEFITKKDLDFSYVSVTWISFRINAFFKLWKVSLVMRRINSNAMTFEELMLPEWAKDISKLHNWLVIVSWPSWAWKSTTITSILSNINENRWEHIVTIENPVEFIYKNKKSIFSQRNVWRDTKNTITWIKSSLKEDPNIVMISNVNNKETFDNILDMVDSWLLVIISINSSSTSDTIKKILWFYSTTEQISIQNKLATNLESSLFQKLVNKSDWNWRVAVFEFMKVTDNIDLLLRSWKTNELPNLINVWLKEWMVSINRYADILVEKWLISKEYKEKYFSIES